MSEPGDLERYEQQFRRAGLPMLVAGNLEWDEASRREWMDTAGDVLLTVGIGGEREARAEYPRLRGGAAPVAVEPGPTGEVGAVRT